MASKTREDFSNEGVRARLANNTKLADRWFKDA